MVDVEQRALRPLEQDAFAVAIGLVQHAPHRLAGVGQDLGGDLQQGGLEPRHIDLGEIQALAQGIVVRQQPFDLGVQRLRVGQVADADRPPPRLVLIGRTDAPSGGADLGLAGLGLPRLVEVAVQRQDQTGIVGQGQQFGRDPDALGFQPADLVDQGPRVDDHAVANDRGLALHHAGRQQAQLVGDVPDDQCVTGVMAALEPHHHIGAIGQPIDDLALALVAPLGTDYCDICQDRSPLSGLGNAGAAYSRGITGCRPIGRILIRSVRPPPARRPSPATAWPPRHQPSRPCNRTRAAAPQGRCGGTRRRTRPPPPPAAPSCV